jgi:hypothetical protein
VIIVRISRVAEVAVMAEVHDAISGKRHQERRSQRDRPDPVPPPVREQQAVHPFVHQQWKRIQRDRGDPDAEKQQRQRSDRAGVDAHPEADHDKKRKDHELRRALAAVTARECSHVERHLAHQTPPDAERLDDRSAIRRLRPLRAQQRRSHCATEHRAAQQIDRHVSLDEQR